MRTFIFILGMLCLVPKLAFCEIQLNFKDGSSLCGNYTERDKAYCRMMPAGDFCVQKNEIKSLMTVSGCGDIDGTGESTGYLKQHNKTQEDLLAKKRASEESDDGYYRSAPEKKAVKMRRSY